MSGAVLALFDQGYSVKEICGQLGTTSDVVTRILTMFGQRPRHSRATTSVIRVCPFFDSCRDCTFQGCALDKFKAVTV